MNRAVSRPLLLVALVVMPAAASAAILYSKFSHPAGDYVIEYPSHWRRSIGLQAIYLHPWGKLGPNALISLERFPLGIGSPKTPADFERDVRKDIGIIMKLDSEGSTVVAGVAARRLALTLSGDPKAPKQTGPYREILLILPMRGEFYYVLKLAGVGKGFESIQPEFEKIARRLRFGAARIEKK